MQRGGIIQGDDLYNQRYYCPTTDFSQCIPSNQQNFALPADSNMPCRTGQSNPMAVTAAGSELMLRWAGNGHTDQWAGTCIKVQMGPYNSDPTIDQLPTVLGTCLPYVGSDGQTQANVLIPAGTAPGDYTLFWVWDFAGFYYSSCADIVVNPSSGSTTSSPNTVVTVNPSGTSSTGPSQPQSTSAPLSTTTSRLRSTSQSSTVNNEMDNYNGKGCSELPSLFCSNAYGQGNYCKSWITDICGRSMCSGDTRRMLTGKCS